MLNTVSLIIITGVISRKPLATSAHIRLRHITSHMKVYRADSAVLPT